MPGQPRTRKGIFGKSGPPAPKGNRRGVVHGGSVTEKSYGPEMREKEDQIRELLAESVPLKDRGKLPAADAPAITVIARQMVRADLMTETLYEQGLRDARGNVNPVVDRLNALDRQILHALAQMGMTPMSRAKLGLTLRQQLTWADAMSEKDPKKRDEIFKELGVIELEEANDAR